MYFVIQLYINKHNNINKKTFSKIRYMCFFYDIYTYFRFNITDQSIYS